MPKQLDFLRSFCLFLFAIFLFGCTGGSPSNGGGGGGGGGTTTLASITPTSVAIGANSVALTVNGSNFTSSSQVLVAGTKVVTTFVSSSQLTGTIPASQLDAAGTLPVTVVTGSTTTSAISFAVQNPAPAVTTLAPSSVAAGSTSASITIIGTGFVNSSTAAINGATRPTAYVSSTQLIVTLTAADLATAGSLPVTVTNAGPGGGTSAAVNLTVAANAVNSPTLTALSPSSIIAGSSDTTLVLTGTNFTATCTVQLNGTTVASQIRSSVYFYATAPSSSLGSTGTLSVTITCGGVTSNALTIAVTNPPAPTLSGLSTQTLPLNTQTSLTGYGTNFTTKTVLQLNGVSLPTTFNSETSVTAVVPSTAVVTFGGYSVAAYTPTPGGGTSAALGITPYVALTNNSMVYNPADGLFYLSVPSSAGSPYGNSVVSVDPVSGALGTPIFVGSDPDRLAISSDGSVLWVGLDGGSAVRKVNMITKTASYQFGLGGNSGVYATPPAVTALAALPGAPDSVVVAGFSSGSFNNPLMIYDSGVARANSFSTYISYPTALQVDGTRNEIYAGASNSYYVFSYSSTGLTTKTTVSSGNFSSYANDDLQDAGGRLYTDFGTVYDTESGSLLGTLYSSGTTVASGPTVADTTLSKIFVLDASTAYATPNQIQSFDLNAYTTSSTTVPIYGLAYGVSGSANPSHLTRWGANGLAFRTGAGFYSLRSNLVKDLSSTNADLGVKVSAPSTTTTGSSVKYTVTLSNAGPSPATEAALAITPPSNGVIGTVTSTQGTCSSTVACDLGTIASGSSAVVTVSVQMLTSGAATLSATALASETDPASSNNSASATVTVTGAVYNLAPALTSLSPSAIQIGQTSSTTLTVNGANFSNASTVLLGGTALTTTYIRATQLTAVVPESSSASLGWGAITVSTPSPGGGTSNALPLSFFQVLTAGLNHILYDPFTRKIMAAVGSGSSTLTGNSIVAITPETGTFGTPVPIGSQPSYLALASDGSILYTILTGAESVARFNMLTQAADFTFTPPADSSFVGGIALRGIAVQPGFPNTIALDIAAFTGIAIYDFNPTAQTATIRGQATGPYTGSSIHFLDTADLFSFDTDTSGATFNHFTVTSAGFTYYNYSQYTESTLNHFGTFTISGNLAFANNGGVADPTTTPATQLGYYPPINSYAYNDLVAPDTSLARVFFLGSTTSDASSSAPDGLIAYDQNSFLPQAATPLDMATIEGNTSYTGVDLIRWGQDGLAALTNGGHLYLLRGAAVVPQELVSNSAATLSSLSISSITHGAGNTTLSVTGSNFIRGAGVFWNGSYRTTTYTDSGDLTIAIPAADLATAGSATITVVNPGASASGSLTFTIQ